MISLRLALSGQQALRDFDTNSISMIGIFEGVSAQGFPILLPHFSFLVVLEREHGDPRIAKGRFDIRLGDTVLASGDMSIDFEELYRTRQIIRITGILISGPGTVSSRFFIGDDLIAESRFEVESKVRPITQTTNDPVENQPAPGVQRPKKPTARLSGRSSGKSSSKSRH